jgi:hypothetical protein
LKELGVLHLEERPSVFTAVVVIVKLSSPSWLNLQQKFDQTKTA